MHYRDKDPLLVCFYVNIEMVYMLCVFKFLSFCLKILQESIAYIYRYIHTHIYTTEQLDNIFKASNLNWLLLSDKYNSIHLLYNPLIFSWWLNIHLRYLFYRVSLHHLGYLETHYVDQVHLELMEIHVPLPLSAGIKGMRDSKEQQMGFKYWWYADDKNIRGKQQGIIGKSGLRMCGIWRECGWGLSTKPMSVKGRTRDCVFLLHLLPSCVLFFIPITL